MAHSEGSPGDGISGDFLGGINKEVTKTTSARVQPSCPWGFVLMLAFGFIGQVMPLGVVDTTDRQA